MLMKKFIFLVAILITVNLCSYLCKFRDVIRKVQCDTSNKTMLNNITCMSRSYKRKSFITIQGTIIRKLPNLKVNFTLQRQNSYGYQKNLNFENLEICKLLRDVSSSPVPFVKDFILYLKSDFGENNILDICDMIGELRCVNASMGGFVAMEMFPAGDYAASYRFFDEKDDKALNLIITSRLFKF